MLSRGRQPVVPGDLLWRASIVSVPLTEGVETIEPELSNSHDPGKDTPRLIKMRDSILTPPARAPEINFNPTLTD